MHIKHLDLCVGKRVGIGVIIALLLLGIHVSLKYYFPVEYSLVPQSQSDAPSVSVIQASPSLNVSVPLQGRCDIFPDTGDDPVDVARDQVPFSIMTWMSEHSGVITSLLDMGYKMSVIISIVRALWPTLETVQKDQGAHMPTMSAEVDVTLADLAPEQRAAFTRVLGEWASKA